MNRNHIQEQMLRELDEDVKRRYPTLPNFYSSITGKPGQYVAKVTFQNGSHTLSALYEYRGGGWYMTRDWND